MPLTIEADPHAEVDFMLHSSIYNRSVKLLDSWPLPPTETTIQRMNISLSAGHSFQHIRFDSLLTLFGQWFSDQQLFSIHLKIAFPADDSDQTIDITVVDTRFRRIKFYSENGAYLPEILRFYQKIHKSQVLDLYLHNSGRFWIELPQGATTDISEG